MNAGTTNPEKDEHDGFAGDIYSVEGVSSSKSPSSKNALLRETRSIEQDSGQCRDPKNPVDVCMNYNPCCELSGTGDSNCLCSNQIIKDCRQVYKDCLAEKYLSEQSMDFISAEKKDVVCKKILTNCCNAVTKLGNSKSVSRGFEPVTMHKPEFSAGKICEIQGPEDQVLNNCKYSCKMNDKCAGIIYNKITGSCELYDKPLVEKEPAYRNETDANTLQFQKRGAGLPGGKEGFGNPANQTLHNTIGTGILTQGQGTNVPLKFSANGTAQQYCLTDAGFGDDIENSTGGRDPGCWKKNRVITDCRKQMDKCNARDIPGLTGDRKKEHCAQMYGACCSILDGMELQTRFKFLDAEAGSPNAKNLLCAGDVTRDMGLEDCKQKCRATPDCMYIYSNLGAGTGPNNGGSGAGYCRLYSGKPLPAGLLVPTFAKKEAGMDSKFIYKKKEVDPDEPVEETTTTTVPAITKTDPGDASK